MGAVHTGKVDGSPAVAGGLTYGAGSEIAAASTAGMFSAVTGATTATTGMIDRYNGVTATAVGSALTAGIGAPDAAVADTLVLVGKTQTAIAAAKAQLAATQAANAASQSASPTSTTALEADIKALETFLAAASGTAAVDAVDAKTVFDNRLEINVDASAETSSGLTFGVRSRIRIEENETGALSAPRVYMKSGAIEVAVGNIYGALDSMPGMYDSEVGLTALSDAGVVLNTVGKGDWAFDGYSSQGKGVNGIEAIYSAGGFTGHLSYSEPDLSGSAAVTNKRVAAVVAYTMGDWTVALGMQDSDNNAEDKTVLTVGGKVGDYGVGFAAADNDGVQKIALNGSATFGATTVNGFVADDESGTDTALGLGVSYDLGGAAVMAGVERDAVGVNRADFGVSFSF